MRRPPAFEFQVPAEPAPLWATRVLQGVAAAVLTHWALAWGAVQWEVSVPPWGSVAAAVILGVLLSASQRGPANGVWLRFDGEHWHWSGMNGDPPSGSGELHVASRLGPWWLLRACAQHGHGRSVWIWLRPEAVCSPWSSADIAARGVHSVDGARLRTLLNWS